MSSIEQNATATARKRLRTVDSDSASTAPPVRFNVKSPDFYFADGSIVLQTVSKTDRMHKSTHFRVHKSVLARHSSVFRGMFGEEDAAHFAGVSEQVDGVPLVHLHDDAEDVEDFLRAMYDPDFMQRHYNPKRHGLTMKDFPKMYNRTIRLAKKYEADDLCTMFASALRQAWPTEWSVQEAAWKARQKTRQVAGYDYHAYHPLNPNPAWTIRMAIDFDIPDVLPYAFYDLSTYLEPSELAVDEDGHDTTTDEAVKDMSLLNANELACLIVGGRRMGSYVYTHVAEHPVPPPDRFTLHRHKCYETIVKVWYKLIPSLEYSKSAFQTFTTLWEGTDDLDVCKLCKKDLETELDGVGEEIWAKLPMFFNLNNAVP